MLAITLCMSRILVKVADKPTRCGLLTEYARVRPVAEYLDYDDWGEFYASYAPTPGMTMYYVRYTHSPYRALVTTDPKVGAIWRPHFAFFGYELAKFSVRVSEDGERCGGVPVVGSCALPSSAYRSTCQVHHSITWPHDRLASVL